MKELRKDSMTVVRAHHVYVVRGHHVYKSVRTPVIGEELYLKPEESNEHNECAVVVRNDGETVGPSD